LPNIEERLRRTILRIQMAVDGVSGLILSRKIEWKWSIREHLGPLLDLESLHMVRIDDFKYGETVCDLQTWVKFKPTLLDTILKI
jgi:hypothetical protein